MGGGDGKGRVEGGGHGERGGREEEGEKKRDKCKFHRQILCMYVCHVPRATVAFRNNLGIPTLSIRTVQHASKPLVCNS